MKRLSKYKYLLNPWLGLFVFSGATILCLASSPAPFIVETSFLKAIANEAEQDSAKTAAATRIMLEIASKRPLPKSDLSLFSIHTPNGQNFEAAEVRVAALYLLGRMGSPEAIEYLERLKPADIGPDSTQTIWPASRVALRAARFGQIQSEPERMVFLENSVTGHDCPECVVGHVSIWARNEICDRGMLTALPVVAESYRRSYPGEAGEAQIRFCEARIRTVNSSPERVTALSSALTLSRPSDQQLTMWAVDQLTEMKSSAADAALEKYGKQIGSLKEGSPEWRDFWIYESIIRDHLAHQAYLQEHAGQK